MGHAKELDIQRGRSSWQDKCGNDAADRLATAAAAWHGPPHPLTAAAEHRMHLATSSHLAAIKILETRLNYLEMLNDMNHVCLWLPSEPD